MSGHFIQKEAKLQLDTMSPLYALTGKINTGHIINAARRSLLLMQGRPGITHSSECVYLKVWEVRLSEADLITKPEKLTAGIVSDYRAVYALFCEHLKRLSVLFCSRLYVTCNSVLLWYSDAHMLLKQGTCFHKDCLCKAKFALVFLK